VATIADFNGALDQAAKELGTAAAMRKQAILAEMSKRGVARSGATFFAQIRALDELSLGHLAQVRTMIGDWAGASGLGLPALRTAAVHHLRDFIPSFLNPAFVSVGQYKPEGGALAAVEGQLAEAAQKAEARIKEIELGVGFGTPRELAAGSVFNIIHAQSVTGGIQQGTHNSQQDNVITLTTTEVDTAIERLEAVLLANGYGDQLAEVKPDLDTMKAQLRKPEPNSNILREAGRSVRTVVEGAVGGAIGNAASPAVIHALGVFGAALGLA